MDDPNKNSSVLAEKLFTAIKTERKDDVEKYLCLGADPNYILLNGISSFHFASGCSQSYQFIRMILQYDGNPNVRNYEGLTPLHVATLWGKSECIVLLIENGADITVKDNEGKDIRWYASESGSSNCMSLVEDLFQSQNLKKTQRSHKAYLNNENVFFTPKNSYDASTNRSSKEGIEEEISFHDRVLSVRSPLHSMCDDSWVLKQRGSSRKRLDISLSSKENWPVQSPNKHLCCTPTSGNMNPNCCRDTCREVTRSCVNCSPLHQNFPVSCNSACLCHRKCSNRCEDCLPRHNSCTNHHNPMPHFFNCGHHVLAKRPEENNNLNEQNPSLDTTDKCIGTSILEPCHEGNKVYSTDSVACQVTLIDHDQFETDSDQSQTGIVVEQAKIQAKNLSNNEKEVNSTSGFESAYNSNHDAAMAEFLKGCDRFLEGDNPKGLDVSSPDHCTSFTLGKKVQVETNSTPSSASQLEKSARNISKNKTCEKVEEIENEEASIDNDCATPTKEQNKEEGDHTPMLTPKLPSRSSPCRNMLFSTKVPLTQSEMAQYYGESSLIFNEVEPKCVEPNTDKNTSSNHGDDNSKQQSADDFTFSDSTVPLVSNEEVFNSSNLKTDKVCSPANEQQSEAKASNLPKASVLNPGLNRIFQCEKILDNPDSKSHQSSVTSPNTTITHLHSTAINDSQNKFRGIDEASFNISLIRDDSEIRVHTDIDGNSWLEHHSPSNVQDSREVNKKEDVQPNLLQLSSVNYSNSSSQSTVVYNWKTFWKDELLPESESSKKRKMTKSSKTSESSCGSGDEEFAVKPPENLTDNEIRESLISYGQNPGPIAACRNVYLKKLEDLMRAKDKNKDQSQEENVTAKNVTQQEEPKFSSELNVILLGRSLPDSVVDDDESVRLQFEQPDPNLRWREGTAKNSFTYLLLDPRVTDKLPNRAKNMSELEAFKSFVGAIFYVGKGKQSRPFSHFYEALQTNVMHYKLNPSKKIRHIHDIWQSGYGVVSLHVFQSIIPCEAYTREAAMIDSIGLTHLTNRKRGDYYGVASSWSNRRKRMYGSYLTMKAMKILMVEGERQIRPANLKSRNATNWTGCQAPVPVPQN